ncbi:MAG: aspartate aminotransferase family protein [Clostridia bacterium]|nr:aspartate aminotransferase family protein [Clostridia bacterium]
MSINNIKEIDKAYVANTYARFPVAWVKGEGAEITDDGGKKYIDLTSGIAVNTFGVADAEWVKAVTDQLSKLQHSSNLYYTEPCALLAKALCEKSGMKKVFFANSGAEANEGAIKAARRRSFVKKGAGHHTIITLKNSFHGRTITTLAATGQDVFHKEFDPFTEGFVYAEAGNADELRSLTEQYNCAAIMIELIQGEGGINVLTQEYVDEVRKIAEEKDLLIIVDEVQTGNGRTGKYFAYMHYGFTPDIVTTAKGLGGGLPIGAVLLGEKAEDALVPGTHASTFGGNPICAAGALNVVNRLDEKFLKGVEERSKFIIDELSGAKGVNGISGMGLMLGIDCQRPVKEVIADAMDKGVLCITAKTKLRLLPPLNISFDELKTAVAVLKEVLAK